MFHETYERLAPLGRLIPVPAVPWEEVPETNRRLMVQVFREIQDRTGIGVVWAVSHEDIAGTRRSKAEVVGEAVTVIGPECFASLDESVVCWRGVNYVRQDAS